VLHATYRRDIYANRRALPPIHAIYGIQSVIKLRVALKLVLLHATIAATKVTFLETARWKQNPSLATSAERRATSLVIAPIPQRLVVVAAAAAGALAAEVRSVIAAEKLDT